MSRQKLAMATISRSLRLQVLVQVSWSDSWMVGAGPMSHVRMCDVAGPPRPHQTEHRQDRSAWRWSGGASEDPWLARVTPPPHRHVEKKSHPFYVHGSVLAAKCQHGNCCLLVHVSTYAYAYGLRALSRDMYCVWPGATSSRQNWHWMCMQQIFLPRCGGRRPATA